MSFETSPMLACNRCGLGNHTDADCPKIIESREKEDLSPEELLSESDQIDLVIRYWHNMNPASTNDAISDNRKLRQAALEMINNKWKERMIQENFKKIYFLGVKDKKNLVATATIWIPDDLNKPAYLGALTVDANYQGKGLSKKLQNKVADIARQAGCKSIESAVHGDSVAALKAEFSSGYKLVRCTDYKRLPEDSEDVDLGGWYSFEKDIDLTEQKEVKFNNTNRIEIKLTDYRKVKELIEVGWKGVDLKYVGNNVENFDKMLEGWVFVLEK